MFEGRGARPHVVPLSDRRGGGEVLGQAGVGVARDVPWYSNNIYIVIIIVTRHIMYRIFLHDSLLFKSFYSKATKYPLSFRDSRTIYQFSFLIT